MVRGKFEKIFEGALWNFRFSIMIVVLALLFSSLVAFFLAINSTREAFGEAFHAYQTGESPNSNEIIVYLISSIDEFLLGIVLIIIALGIYELFISKLDVVEGGGLPYPAWLTFKSLDELKAVLTKVLLIILMVYFFKSVVLLKFTTPLSILYLAIGILLLALANYFSHKAPLEAHAAEKKEKH